MKEVIDLKGEKKQVPVSTTVKTKKGVHYLLTAEEQAERDVDKANAEARKAAYITGDKYKDDRRAEYNKRGATLEALTVLMWKKEMGEDVEKRVADIQTLRAEVELKFPKP